MEMTHLGYIAYCTMVIAICTSPFTLLALYRGWKSGRFCRRLFLILIGLPIVGAISYLLLRLGVFIMAQWSRS